MKIHEYQGKELFRKYGVPTPRGILANTPEEAEKAAKELATPVVVVKAQIHAGGRGKGGGVKLAKTYDEVRDYAKGMLGTKMATYQTAGVELPVDTVLVTQATDIAKELYLSVLVDRSSKSITFIASAEGGMDIEQLAVERPEALARVPVDQQVGIDQAKADEIVATAGFAGEDAAEIARVIQILGTAYAAEDATLVEVNPLVRDPQDHIIALDGKVTLDENADFRHEAHAGLVDAQTENPLEAKAKAKGLNYVKLDDGQVGRRPALCVLLLELPRVLAQVFPDLLLLVLAEQRRRPRSP